MVQQAAYTGPRGARGRDFVVDAGETSQPVFSTTRPLGPSHGLTVAVAWPKGHVPEPTAAQKTRSMLLGNASLFIRLADVLLLFGIYMHSWNVVGRDPAKGAIIPRFLPQAGLSPASSRVVRKMDFDDKAFAAAVVNMAVKGFLTISEEKSGYARTFTLIRTGKSKEEASLSRGEASLASTLFPGTGNQVVLSQADQSRLRKAREDLRRLLYLEHEKVHFFKNKQYIFMGGGLTLITLAAMGLFAPAPELALFMSVWLSIWSIGVVFLVSSIVATYRAGGRAGLVFQVLFALPFLLGQVGGLAAYAFATSPASALVMLGMTPSSTS